MRIANKGGEEGQPDENQVAGSTRELVGLIPAAGIAARLAPLPCSKELLPIGYTSAVGDNIHRPKPVCLYLLESLRAAGVRRAHIVLRSGKWDIPTYLGSGAGIDMEIGYHIMEHPYGAPFTIDAAYPFIRDANIAFGFPDIVYRDPGVYQALSECLETAGCDAAIGLFPVQPGQRADMVETDEQDRVRRILIKPDVTELKYAWITAVWKPTFTEFLHQYIAAMLKDMHVTQPREIYIGHVLQAAVDQGFGIQAVRFPDVSFYDIGTPEGLRAAAAQFGASRVEQ